MTSADFINLAHYVIPVLVGLSVFLIVVGFGMNSSKQEVKVEHLNLLEEITESEIADILDIDENKVKREQTLGRWTRKWLELYKRSGRLVGEDVKFPGRQVIIFTVIAGAIGMIVAKATGAVLALVAVPVLWAMKLQSEAHKREALIDSQMLSLAQSMEQNCRALIPSEAFRRSVDDIPEPLRSELEEVRSKVDMGVSFEQALSEFAEKHNSREISFFCSAMVTSLTSGADIEPQLKVIVDKLSARKSIRDEVSTSISQARGPLIFVASSVPAALLASAAGLIDFSFATDEQGMVTEPSLWESAMGVWFSSPTGILALGAVVGLWGAAIWFLNRSINGVSKF